MQKRPLLLDLCSKAGGAAYGYYLAGFDVVSIDIEPQPNYPEEEGMRFFRADAVEYLHHCGHCFDAYHASPPCQAHTRMQTLGKARNGGYREHIDLINPIRELLIASGRPYVIENVPGAPLINPYVLCGSMFPDLRVYRHRLFETNWLMMVPPHEAHRDKTPSAGNGKSPKGFISVCGSGGVRGMKCVEILEYWRMAMGIPWMNRKELAQAIPPRYTEMIGLQLQEQLKGGSNGKA